MFESDTLESSCSLLLLKHMVWGHLKSPDVWGCARIYLAIATGHLVDVKALTYKI